VKPQFHRRVIHDVNPVSGRIKKRRTIFVPNDAMKDIQLGILERIRSANIKMLSATGGIKGENVVSNVLAHKMKNGRFPRYFYLVDLSSAYENTLVSVGLIGLKHEYPQVFDDEFVELIATHCVVPCEGLATGGPASPDIFNLCMEYSIDRALRVCADKYNITYTRYIDDLTFSSEKPIGKKKRNAIMRILHSAGCVVNHAKTQVLDIYAHPVLVTGVGLKRSGEVFIPRRTMRTLIGLLHRAIHKRDVPDQVVLGKLSLFVYLLRKGLVRTGKNHHIEKKLYTLYMKYRHIRQS
jgi:hypothetical protein